MEDLIKDPETTVIDVREINEFESGHFEGAINIPLGSIPMRIAELKAMNGPIVVYCRSGNRSGMAMSLLKQDMTYLGSHRKSKSKISYYTSR